ncbi:MAG: hypothetical protein ABIQ25_04570 [Sphingomicrobium sp.]
MTAALRALVLTPGPDYHEAWDWAYDVEARALGAAGFTVEPQAWTKADPAGADVVLPLVAWGYDQNIAKWHALLDRAEAENWPMINPPALLRWNSDKNYLTQLAEAGVATVPTLAVADLDEAALSHARAQFGTDQLVVKPPVSASAAGTFRIGRGEPIPSEVAGRAMMVQPFQRAIAEIGEYSLMLFGGDYGHTIVKRPRAGDFRVQPHLGGRDFAADPPPGALALAHAALAAAPARAVYARVDMIQDNDGALAIMELELIEPALFLHQSTASAAMFGAAVASAARALRA